jgi:hypothetical protein
MACDSWCGDFEIRELRVSPGRHMTGDNDEPGPCNRDG